MDIFELAMAKKMFGGGGGKREGTAVPAGEKIDRIYFNINNTIEETDAILSQLTFVQTPLIEQPIYAVYANTDDGIRGTFLFILDRRKSHGAGYTIMEACDLAKGIDYPFYTSLNKGSFAVNGWEKRYKATNWNVDSYGLIVSAMDVFSDGQSLTEFSGIPVGAENEKIKNVLSITPF